MNITVTTFNVGSGWLDYVMMVNGDKTEQENLKAALYNSYPRHIKDFMLKGERTKEENLSISNVTSKIQADLQEKIEANVAKKLTGSDVICLQEVGNINRAFIKTLKELDYQIYFNKEPINDEVGSTAIAVKYSLFSEVKNVSIQTSIQDKAIYGQEVACIVGKLNGSDKTLALASLHSWGFQLYPPKHANKQYLIRDMTNSSAYLTQAAEQVEKQKADYAVLAGDMNNNPENYFPPFDYISARNYEILRAEEHTNVNWIDEGYNFRESDFIFAKKIPVWKKVLNWFLGIFKSYFTVSKAAVHQDFTFTMDGNCSDHRPVSCVITLHESLASKIHRYISSFF